MLVGMAVAATAATIASFSGLSGLAAMAGWPNRLAWLLPVTLDAYAMTSARVWLADTTRTERARRFARANAIGAITASITGNAVYHAAQIGLLAITWPVVVIVGAVPAAILGLTAHLHALQGSSRRPAPAVQTPTTTSTTRTGTTTGPRHPARQRSDAELLTAARAADARHRQAHDGRPISRDALRAALRISGPRATELRRQLAAEPQPSELASSPPSPAPDREENRTHR